jgi:hypothetical protein
MKMAPITHGFALIFIALGLAGFIRSHAPTSLIPTVLGVLLWICALIAVNPDRKKHAMHAAVALGFVGFCASARGLFKLPLMVQGEPVARPLAVVMQSLMAVFCAVYVVLCTASFIEARRNRLSEAKKP